MSATTPRTREQTINIRAHREQIDQAAFQLGQSRSAFVLERSLKAAEAVILDKCLFSLDDTAYDLFQARLNAPAEPNPKLAALLRQKAPWDK